PSDAGWSAEFGQNILQGKLSLEEVATYAQSNTLTPRLQSGRQEMLESLVTRYMFGSGYKKINTAE
ncbi:hypothetical protein O9354_19100, partial [Proteus mirabilis]|nr:hypothetical protein [Proteus mirabilis]